MAEVRDVVAWIVLAVAALFFFASLTGNGHGMFGGGFMMGFVWVWVVVIALAAVALANFLSRRPPESRPHEEPRQPP